MTRQEMWTRLFLHRYNPNHTLAERAAAFADAARQADVLLDYAMAEWTKRWHNPRAETT